MTMQAKRRRMHEKLAGLPGVRPIRRPISPDWGHHPLAGDAEEFDLYYVLPASKPADQAFRLN
jgi:proline iminopeptidase